MLLRLVIPNKNRRAGSQILFILYNKLHSRRPAHRPLETSRDGPLAQTTVSHTPQGNGCDNSIPSAEDETGEGGEDAGIKPGGGEDVGQE